MSRLYCDIEVLPVFFKFTPHQQTNRPLESINPAKVGEWTEQRLMEFVDIYLQLEHSDQYQQGTLVTDPVCGARFRKMMAGAKHEYHGVLNQRLFSEENGAFGASVSLRDRGEGH